MWRRLALPGRAMNPTAGAPECWQYRSPSKTLSQLRKGLPEESSREGQREGNPGSCAFPIDTRINQGNPEQEPASLERWRSCWGSWWRGCFHGHRLLILGSSSFSFQLFHSVATWRLPLHLPQEAGHDFSQFSGNPFRENMQNSRCSICQGSVFCSLKFPSYHPLVVSGRILPMYEPRIVLGLH